MGSISISNITTSSIELYLSSMDHVISDYTIEMYIYTLSGGSWSYYNNYVQNYTTSTNNFGYISTGYKDLYSASNYAYRVWATYKTTGVRTEMTDGTPVSFFTNSPSGSFTWYLPGFLTSMPNTNPPSFSWSINDTGKDIYRYDIQYSTDNSNWITYTNVYPSGTTHDGTPSGTIYNLNYSTTYYIRYIAWNQQLNFNWISSVYSATSGTAPAPTGTPSITVTCAAGRNVTVSWSGVSGANNYIVYVNNYAGSGDVQKYSGSSTSTSFTVDSEYHTFYAKVVPYNSGTQGTVNTKDFTTLDETDPVVDTFYVAAPHATSIDVVATAHDITPSYNANNGQSGLKGYWFYISYDNGTNWTFVKQVDTTGTGYYTFSNGVDGVTMLGNTAYKFGVRAIDNANPTRSSTMVTITGTTQYLRPTDFYFRGSLSNENTYIAYGQPFSNLTASDWNALQDKVNEFRQYKSTQAVPLPSYSFTRATSGGNFTYAMYNEMRNAIVDMTASIPPYRNKGDTILASDIRGLASALRGIT